MKRAKELNVTVTIPKDIVSEVIKARKAFISGKSSDEYLDCQIVTNWLYGQVDTAVEINEEILSAYGLN